MKCLDFREDAMTNQIASQTFILPFHLAQSRLPNPISAESTWSGVCKITCPFEKKDRAGHLARNEAKYGSGFLLEFEGNGRTKSGIITCRHVMFHRNQMAPRNQVQITFQTLPQAFYLEQISSDTPPIYDPFLDFYFQELSSQFVHDVKELHIRFLKRRLDKPCFEEFYLVHYPEGGERKVSIGKFISQIGNPANHVLYSKSSTRPGSSGGALIESDGTDGFVFAMHTAANSAGTVDHSTLVAYILARMNCEATGPLGIPAHWCHTAQSLLGNVYSHCIISVDTFE